MRKNVLRFSIEIVKKTYILNKKQVILALLFIALLIQVVVLYTIRIDKPGIGYDEVRPTASMAIYYRLHKSLDVPYINIFGTPVIFMRDGYIGGIEGSTYLFISRFISHPFLFRFMSIGFAVVTILLIYYILNKLLRNSLITYLATSAMALSPTMVIFSRIGVNVNFSAVLFGTLLVVIFIQYIFTSSNRWLLLFVFIGGLSVGWVRLNLAWILISAAIYMILFQRKDLRLFILSRNIISSILLFLLGILPFIAYGLATSWSTFQLIQNNATQTSIFQHNNLDVLTNLIRRFFHIFSLLQFDVLWFPQTRALSKYVPTLFFVTSSVWFSTQLWKRAIKSRKRKILIFLFVVIITSLILSIFSVSNIKEMHLLIIYPTLYLFIILCMSEWIRNKYLLMGLLTFLLVSNMITTKQHVSILIETGGMGMFTDKIYELHEYLSDKSNEKIYYLDWGISENIYTLSNGGLSGKEIFQYQRVASSQFIEENWTELLRGYENVLIVARSKDEALFPDRTDQLAFFLAKNELSLQTDKIIYVQGVPQFIVYSLIQTTN